jgi:hypothetical protein
MSIMTFGSRLTVAILATVLALPFGSGACVFLLDRGIGDDSVHTSRVPAYAVLGAIVVLGAFTVFAIGSCLTGGKIDGQEFPMGYVAVCATGGMILGLVLVAVEPIGGALGLALLGGFVATFAKPRAGRNRLPRDSALK